MALYQLKICLVNGNTIAPYQQRIIKELHAYFAQAENARNKKRLQTSPRYDNVENCITIEIYSEAVLDSPGHVLSGVSRRLLKSTEPICRQLNNELLGKRLFKIYSKDISEQSKPKITITDCQLLQILSSLLLDEKNVKERHLCNEIITELKNILVEKEYIQLNYLSK